MSKISIRFFNDREVRAIWDDEHSKWFFSVLDIVGVLNDQSDYEKNRNYWKYLKAKLKKEGNQLGSVTTQLKLTAPDGKKRYSSVLDYEGIIALAKVFPSSRANRFIEWFTYSDETIDGKSKQKAYALFESSFIDSIEVGTVKGLQQIHAYLFGGLYDFAGQIRTVNLMKPDGEAPFAYAEFVPSEAVRIFTQLKHDRYLVGLKKAEFVQKISALAADLNALHPFREGNGRTIRLFLALLAKHAGYIIDYSQVSHEEVILADKLAFGGKYDVIVKVYNRITTPATNQHSVR